MITTMITIMATIMGTVIMDTIMKKFRKKAKPWSIQNMPKNTIIIHMLKEVRLKHQPKQLKR